jgi:hypothetical protein
MYSQDTSKYLSLVIQPDGGTLLLGHRANEPMSATKALGSEHSSISQDSIRLS